MGQVWIYSLRCILCGETWTHYESSPLDDDAPDGPRRECPECRGWLGLIGTRKVAA